MLMCEVLVITWLEKKQRNFKMQYFLEDLSSTVNQSKMFIYSTF